MAAGCSEAEFWSITPRAFVVTMRGLRLRARMDRLRMAEAVRAGSLLEHDDWLAWVQATDGQDRRLPESALAGALRSASVGVPAITMQQALERMH
ncbi:hypothetical protein [Gemmobacter caeni]|uniref:hypothetical protein n=1 Tax=Gemmobacter caeni TaxID=589035 RepID=UPI000D3BD7C2|nr:hypothetical protein [Gemmobacter caeni]